MHNYYETEIKPAAERLARLLGTKKVAITYGITVDHVRSVQFPSVACYTGQSPEEGPFEANIYVKPIGMLENIPELPF